MNELVSKYIESIGDDKRRDDILCLVKIISNKSNKSPEMWGSSIIAFGTYNYRYDSGRVGEAPIIGLSSRKQAIVIYGLNISDTTSENNKLLAKLGKHGTGKGCLYIKSLKDIDILTLEKMIQSVHQ